MNSCVLKKISFLSQAKSKGFTLLEVMIALVIVSTVLPALLISLNTILDGTAHMEDKTHAYWLAENKVQELKLIKQLKNKMPKGRELKTAKYVEREWDVEVVGKEIDYAQFNAKIVQFDVRVRLTASDNEADGWLATLSGFFDATPDKAFSGIKSTQLGANNSSNSIPNNGNSNNNSINRNSSGNGLNNGSENSFGPR